MVRLTVSVEGETEERFLKKVVAPHLQGCKIYVYPALLGRSGGDV